MGEGVEGKVRVRGEYVCEVGVGCPMDDVRALLIAFWAVQDPRQALLPAPKHSCLHVCFGLLVYTSNGPTWATSYITFDRLIIEILIHQKSLIEVSKRNWLMLLSI